MKYQELVILLPCHSLEDFPTHHEGDEAQGLLANWSALWHPALLASAGKIPSWYRAEDPPEEVTDRLIVVPRVSISEMPTGYAQRAKDEGGCLVRNKLDRAEIVSTALESLDGGDAGIEQQLAADFLALGYCYLQVELLTRQMRYSSNLDELHFQNQVIAAANAAVAGDSDETHKKLAACFDVLAEERDHYYPVDAYILDLTMVAETTIGASLRDELQSPTPINLLLNGGLLEKMADQEPRTLECLRAAIEEQRVGIIGGDEDEARFPLISCEAVLNELRRGIACFEGLLGKRPNVYGRRRFGLTPQLPQLLHRLGFQGALHATLEDGIFPEGSQLKVRWEGSDGTAIDSIARPPIDASKPQAYLNYAIKMGESMDMDHVATVCLAHWPGSVSPWYEDLRRIAKYCAALGKFVTMDEFFNDSDLPVHQDRFEPDQYRSPYLKQAIIRKQSDPISSSIRYWQRRAKAEATQSFGTLAALVNGNARGDQSLLVEVDRSAEASAVEASAVDSLDNRLDAALAESIDGLAGSLSGAKGDPQSGILIVNPSSFVRRTGVDISALSGLPTIERPIYSADSSGENKYAVVDVPSMGFAWIGAGKQAKKRKADKPLAEDCLLRNEFFELLIDPSTGALRALHSYDSRSNRLSQQLAYRLPGASKRASGEVWRESDAAAGYSVMAADSIETTIATTTVGEIIARGRLLDKEGQRLSGFTQTYRVWRGSRVVQIEIELDPNTECKSDPWHSYFAARFAWANEAAEVRRSLNGNRVLAESRRLEAPHYLEIDDGADRTSILTGGLPFHRRDGMRMLDSLLIVRGETARSFRIGIGVDLPHPMHEAISLLNPPTQIATTAVPPQPSSGWLFHLDARNVVATHWEPIEEGDRMIGFRARLIETAGRPGKVRLSAFRPITAARTVDFLGNLLSDCTIDEGRVAVQLASNEYIELEATF